MGSIRSSPLSHRSFRQPYASGPGSKNFQADKDQQSPLLWGVMNPATDVETKEAVERFARMSPAEQDAVMSRGRLIQTLDDLEGLSEADVAHLRPIIEAQTATP